MHSIISTHANSNATAVAAALRGLSPQANFAEVRLDYLWPTPPNVTTAAGDFEVLLASGKKLLATLRPVRQGGQFEGEEKIRLGLLAGAGQAGFSALDIESDNAKIDDLVQHLKGYAGAVILSAHLPDAPDTAGGLRHLTLMQDALGTLHKLVFPANNFAHFLRALELAHVHAGRSGKPAICPLGRWGGAMERAALALAGNRATYGASDLLENPFPSPGLEEIFKVWNHWDVRREELDALSAWPAKWLAVVGDPVEHSLSPRLHNAALRAAGRMERFGAIRTPQAAGLFRLLIQVAPRLGLAGLSVTAPHKVLAQQATSPDELAQRVGASNCIRFEGSVARSTNTDVTALLQLLPKLTGKSTLVLGTGGAARAAIVAMQELGAVVHVAGRDAAKVAAIATHYKVKSAAMDMIANVVIQATPEPLTANLDQAEIAVEMQYAHPSALLENANELGVSTIAPTSILVAQAENAYRFWFNSDAPAGAMAASLEKK